MYVSIHVHSNYKVLKSDSKVDANMGVRPANRGCTFQIPNYGHKTVWKNSFFPTNTCEALLNPWHLSWPFEGIARFQSKQ